MQRIEVLRGPNEVAAIETSINSPEIDLEWSICNALHMKAPQEVHVKAI